MLRACRGGLPSVCGDVAAALVLRTERASERVAVSRDLVDELGVEIAQPRERDVCGEIGRGECGGDQRARALITARNRVEVARSERRAQMNLQIGERGFDHAVVAGRAASVDVVGSIASHASASVRSRSATSSTIAASLSTWAR